MGQTQEQERFSDDDNQTISSNSSLIKAGLFTRISLFYKYYIEEKFLYRRRLNMFWRLFGGHIFFQTICAGIELDLFNLLDRSRGLTLEQICQFLKIKEQPCQILLLGLVTSGVLRKRKNRYLNSRLAEEFLISSAPRKLVSSILWQQHINYLPMYHFTGALRANANVGLDSFPGSGNTLYERLVSNPDKEKIFQDAMEELSKLSNNLLAQFVDFSDVSDLIDVGGGNATNIITIAKKYPKLKARVFDSPSVCQIARANIDNHGMSNRLGAIEGNIFRDELPENCSDCVIFCHFFTMWSLSEDLELLKKAHRGLRPGGKVLIFNMMQNDEGDGPLTAAIGSPYFLTLATGRGMLYTWKQYEDLFAQAGFSNIRRLQLLHDHGVIVARK